MSSSALPVRCTALKGKHLAVGGPRPAQHQQPPLSQEPSRRDLRSREVGTAAWACSDTSTPMGSLPVSLPSRALQPPPLR